MPSVTIVVSSNMQEIERLAAEVSRFAKANHIAPEAAADLHLALEEVVANVIMHAYPQGGAHDIQVEITAEEDRLSAQVEDDGIDFNPLRQADPDVSLPIEKRPVGGLGLFLVRKMMDELSYSREAGRNRLTMSKRFTRA